MFKFRNRYPAARRAFPARCFRGIEATPSHINGALQTAAGYTGGPGGRGAALTRWAAGIIFLIFGVAKFSDHAAELASFRHYPLPAPEVFVYLAGVIEIGAGLLLVAMITLIRLGAGCWSVDRQTARKAARRHGPHPGHARHHLVVPPGASGGQRRS